MTTNAPVIGNLATAFFTSLIAWGVASVEAPGEVEATGAALAIALFAWAVGKVTQRWFTDPKPPAA